MSYFARKKRQWQESAWLLGICLNGFEDLQEGKIQWVDNGKYSNKKWFADPFILEYDNHFIFLLVEEFDYKVHRGRIAKLTIDRNNWTVIDCKILLDLDTHLSFPMIWREGTEVYVCPENYQSGGWNVYRYNSAQEKLEYVQHLIDEKLTDAIIWQSGKSYFLLSTYDPKPNGSELTIWKSSELLGKYEQYQRIKFDENIGRNAGMLFCHEDKWIRPAQECNTVYGHAIYFQEVRQIDGKFTFKEIYRFYSPHSIYNRGIHTYNTFKDMAVIDVKGDRYRWMAKLIRAISQAMVMLGIKKQFVYQ